MECPRCNFKEDPQKLSWQVCSRCNLGYVYNVPPILTSELKIASLESEISYWKFKYKLVQKYGNILRCNRNGSDTGL